jgi:hypothetical protein
VNEPGTEDLPRWECRSRPYTRIRNGPTDEMRSDQLHSDRNSNPWLQQRLPWGAERGFAGRARDSEVRLETLGGPSLKRLFRGAPSWGYALGSFHLRETRERPESFHEISRSRASAGPWRVVRVRGVEPRFHAWEAHVIAVILHPRNGRKGCRAVWPSVNPGTGGGRVFGKNQFFGVCSSPTEEGYHKTHQTHEVGPDGRNQTVSRSPPSWFISGN